jgi:hypothetical protein
MMEGTIDEEISSNMEELNSIMSTPTKNNRSPREN